MNEKDEHLILSEKMFFTNDVLVDESGKEDTYYLPCYVRLKVKNVRRIEIEKLAGSFNAVILFSVYYGNLSSSVVQSFRTKMSLQFVRDDLITLDDQENINIQFKNNEKEKMLNYTIRKCFSTTIRQNIFWSPFEIIDFVLSITVQNVLLENKQTHKSMKFKFNCMATEEGNCDYEKGLQHSHYKLAQSRIALQYTNTRNAFFQSSEQPAGQRNNSLKKAKLQNYQYVHIKIPFYKFPFATLATICIPLWSLGIINLGIFFMEPNLADRIADIATLMLAFVAFIPTIHVQIPPSPTITFIQFLIIGQTLTGLLCFVDSMRVRNMRVGAMRNQLNDPFFLVSLLMTIFSIVSILILWLAHKFIWEPSYKVSGGSASQEEAKKKLVRTNWHNKSCDQHFKKFPQVKAYAKNNF